MGIFMGIDRVGEGDETMWEKKRSRRRGRRKREGEKERIRKA